MTVPFTRRRAKVHCAAFSEPEADSFFVTTRSVSSMVLVPSFANMPRRDEKLVKAVVYAAVFASLWGTSRPHALLSSSVSLSTPLSAA